MSKNKTRFAPSPTGPMHIGGVRAVLLPYIFSKKNNGTFLLRFDDTDKERSKQQYVDDLLNNIHWLNIEYDETFKQSDRIHIYNEIFDLLKSENLIYECSESHEELEEIKMLKRSQKKAPIITRNDCKNRKSNESYWRFDLNKNTFDFDDIIQGHMHFGRDWSDPIIKKPDLSYTYIFASVVDDIKSEITHIIRGEDHLVNTAAQKTLGDAICQILYKTDWNINFAHFSFFIDDDGAKISKRNLDNDLANLKHLDPMTFWSVMTSLGTSNNQIFSIDKQDYINLFDLSKFSKAKQKFSYDILQKTNKKIFHIRLAPDNYDKNLWDLLKENANDINHMNEMIEAVKIFKNTDSELMSNIKKYSNFKELFENILKNKFPNIKDAYKYIYCEVFKQPFGPPIDILINYLNK